MWNLKSSVSAVCQGDLGRECVPSQAHHRLWRAVTAAVSPVAGDTFQGPEHHDSDPSGDIWVICLVPARSVLNMRARTAAVTTGPFLPLLPAPTSKQIAHITLYPLLRSSQGVL